MSRIAWCRDDVRGGSCVRGAPRSRCGNVVLAIGTNGLPVNTRVTASNAPKAFLRAVENRRKGVEEPEKRGRESFLMLLSAARGTAT